MVDKFETRQLRVMLTDEERLKLSQDIGRASQNHSQAREQAKEVSAAAKAEVERFRLQVEEIGSVLANGYEYRDVEVVVAIDLDERRVRATRTDTGEVIEDRRARPDELQGSLPI